METEFGNLCKFYLKGKFGIQVQDSG